MKKILLSITLVIGLVSVGFCQSQTNTPANPPTLVEQAKTIANTNLNAVLVQILSGVKEGGGEIYAASKGAIIKSVDFIKEQTPQVIEQFLTWQFCYALTWAIIWALVAGIIFAFSRHLANWVKKVHKGEAQASDDDTSFGTFVKWAMSIICVVIFLVGVGTNTMEMVKIKVAPKVYVIEYLVDIYNQHENQRR